MSPRMLLLIAILLTIIIYSMGLAGPFLFDDMANLAQASRWLDGRATFYEAVWGTPSGLLHRPVSMLSFVFDAWLGGIRPTHFKLTNLLIHLGCGLAIWMLMHRVLTLCLGEGEQSRNQARLIAAIITIIWLLHPLNVSTVLYVVQRMAQLSTLFVVLALIAYIEGRHAMRAGKSGLAWILLFAVFPTLFLLGVASKENAIVGSTLCLLIELTLFNRQRGEWRPLALFFGVFLVLPAITAPLLTGLSPASVLSGYEGRDFTLAQRLLTQSRILFDYISQMLFPAFGRMGLYQDDIRLSLSLFNPISTFTSMVGLIGLTAVGLIFRKRAPLILFGWCFFLIAHSVESTVLPLELYFEHRNYLPSVGIWLMLVGVILAAQPWWIRHQQKRLPIGAALIVLVTLTFAGMTFLKTKTWRSAEDIAAEGFRHHPQSLRAHLDLATAMLERNRLDETRKVLEHLDTTAAKGNKLIAQLGLASIDCLQNDVVHDDRFEKIRAEMLERVTLAELQAFSQLSRVATGRNCADLTRFDVANLIAEALDKTEGQSDLNGAKWRLRLQAALDYAAAGDLDSMLPQAKLAWNSAADPAAGSVLIQGYLAVGDIENAEQVLAELSARIRPGEQLGQAVLNSIRPLVENAKREQSKAKNADPALN